MASGSGSPCGACKFLRRKCASDCVFAPYFCSEQGPTRFAAIHKVFGASNVSKLLWHLPMHERYEAAVTVAYEAQARVDDPVYGCVAHIFALQQQVASLQAQVMHLRTQLAHNIASNTRSIDKLCQGSNGVGSHLLQPHTYYGHSNTSSNSSLNHIDAISVHEAYLRDGDSLEPCMKKRAQCNDLGDLHDLASRMMRS